MSQLPQGWVETTLGELSEYVTSGSRDWSKYYATHGALFVRTQDINKNKLCAYNNIARVALPEKAEGKRTRLHQGDLLITITGANVGKCAIVEDDPPEAYVSQSVALVRLRDNSLASYLHKQVLCPIAEDLKTWFEENSYGMGRPVLSLENVRSMPIRLAPKPEQKRIADKLDALLVRVGAARARLDRIPDLLKRFRQSVLAFATSGELTEEWRGKTGTGWEMKRIDEVGKVQLGRQRSPRYHQGQHMRPYLRVQNVFEDRIDLEDVMEMDFPPNDFEKYQLHPGDILLNEGQSPQYLGRPAMYRGEFPGVCFTNSLIRFKASAEVNPEFALLVFRHHMHSGRYIRESKITTNIAHLSASRFSSVEFPLPSLAEQLEIIRRTKSLFAIADKVQARYEAARAQVERLTPALLAEAFRGELVPQDPADESAEQLLARIRFNTSNATSFKQKRGAKAPVKKQSKEKRA